MMPDPAPAAPGFVGVDVVDVASERCIGKGTDPRFLRRVLADAERGAVARAADPDRALWRMWAAKEAAFKVVSKILRAPPSFVHSSFRVEPPDPEVEGPFGRVRWMDLSVRVHWHEETGRVGAIGWDGAPEEEPIEWGWGALAELDPDPDAPLERLLERLSERERAPVHSRGSALVRIAARRALARALEVEPGRIQVICGEGPRGRMPPEALLDGRPAPADVSLSHHGRWLAWAVRRFVPLAVAGAGDGEGA